MRKILQLLRESKVIKKYETLDFKLSRLWQRLLSSPLERGAGVCCGKLTHPFIPSF
jgi:hypothetical protein